MKDLQVRARKGDREVEVIKKKNGLCSEAGDQAAAAESSETSSICVDSPSTSSEEEVESKEEDGALASLDSLQESLPIKRGLSCFFAGKSKSFTSLSDVATMSANDLAKPENPFNNKRRRILAASKARRGSLQFTRLHDGLRRRRGRGRSTSWRVNPIDYSSPPWHQ